MATPDAVTVGDYHLKNVVAWHLESRPRDRRKDDGTSGAVPASSRQGGETVGKGGSGAVGSDRTCRYEIFGISELIAEKRQSPLPRPEGSPKQGDAR